MAPDRRIWQQLSRHSDRRLTMAIAGGMTSAYQFMVENYTLKTVKATTYPAKECANIEAAVSILERGESVIVAAGDVAKLRSRLASYGIG